MESVTETPKASRDYIPLLAVVGGIIAVVSLFIYWVNIDTTFSYSFFEIPYTMKATAIKVVEGSTDIPDDWHIYCPALAGIFAIIGLIFAAFCILRKKRNLSLYVAVFVCGLLSLQFAILFAAWNFDVMYTVTESDQSNIEFLAAALYAELGDPSALMNMPDIQSILVTAQAVGGDSTAQSIIQAQVIQQAIDSGMDPTAAAAYFTPEVATQTAAAQVKASTSIDLYDSATMAAISADSSAFMTQYAVGAINATMGLDLTDPAVQAALSAANPADFVAGNELVVGYMRVQDVVEYGFWACIVGGLLVTITGIVGTLKALRH